MIIIKYQHILNQLDFACNDLINRVVEVDAVRTYAFDKQEDYYVALCEILNLKTVPSKIFPFVQQKFNTIFVLLYNQVQQNYIAETNKINNRTVVKKANSANDYGKGMPSAVCKDMLDEKQILPHSKIDSFVYATKPSDMYNEWGNFWDPDNRQRGKFEAVYKVYKKISNEIKEYDEKLEGIENKLKKLNIEQKVRDYNKSV